MRGVWHIVLLSLSQVVRARGAAHARAAPQPVYAEPDTATYAEDRYYDGYPYIEEPLYFDQQVGEPRYDYNGEMHESPRPQKRRVRPMNRAPPPYAPAGVYPPQHARGPSAGFASNPEREQRGKSAGEQKEDPVRVQVEHVLALEPTKPAKPPVRGHGFFFLGLVALVLCAAAVGGAERNESGGWTLHSRTNPGRFLFIMVTALLAPLFLVIGTVNLILTLPRYLAWAYENDEISFSGVGMIILYVWFLFLGSPSK